MYAEKKTEWGIYSKNEKKNSVNDSDNQSINQSFLGQTAHAKSVLALACTRNHTRVVVFVQTAPANPEANKKSGRLVPSHPTIPARFASLRMPIKIHRTEERGTWSSQILCSCWCACMSPAQKSAPRKLFRLLSFRPPSAGRPSQVLRGGSS